MHPIDILVTYWPKLLSGVGITLTLTLLAALIAGALAPLLALVRVNAGPIAQAPLRLYISFMRGTPLLGTSVLLVIGCGSSLIARCASAIEAKSSGRWEFHFPGA